MSSSNAIRLTCLALCCAAMALAQTAPTTLFQLDGNGAQNPNWPLCTYVDKSSLTTPKGTITVTCDYWNLLNGAGGTSFEKVGAASDHFNVFSFIDGSLIPLSFTGQGGEKDTQDPLTWTWSSLGSPDKDTLNNGYVAAYTGTTGPNGVSNGHLVLVFGTDRESTQGDANIGIWFFQNNVSPTPTPTGSNSGTFTAGHKDKDVFVSSAFTGGGTIPDIAVYMWDSTCTGTAKGFDPKNPDTDQPGVCADKNIRFLFAQSNVCLSGALPGGTVSSAPVCGITNQSGASISWSSPIKSGTTGQLPAQTLFMGGIDLTYIFQTVLGGANVPCFTTFLMTTRTSQTIGSTVKDFLTGSFPLCSITIQKACQCDTILNNGIPTGNNTSSSYEYQVSGSVNNNGFGDLSNVTVTDKGLTFNCGALAAGTQKLWGVGAGANDCSPAATNPICAGVDNGNCFISTLKPEANTATVTATPTGGGSSISATFPATGTVACPATAAACNPVPGLTPSKCCSVGINSSAQVVVGFDGRVTNSGNEALTSLSVVDAVVTNVNGTLTTGSYGSAFTLNLFGSNNVSKGTCTSCTLLPGDYVTFTGSYLPSGSNAADLVTNSGSATFRDRMKVTATRPDTGASITNDSQTATCTITLGQACPAP